MHPGYVHTALTEKEAVDSGMTPEAYAELVTRGEADPIRTCLKRDCSAFATNVGLGLIWIAAVLTFLTGWDYFRKALPFLRDK